jgi:DNA invertase Pin-like site-specific DNA recombinase
MAGFVAYYRVSTERQGESGLGLQAQRDAVLRLIGEGSPLAEFTEVESGKASSNRPQLKAALELCKRRKATLVIAKLDRLSRNLHFISGLIESGIEFKAADNPHANKMTVQMLAVFAEHEREMISQRTKQALRAAKANGKVLGNPRWQQSLVEARRAKNPTPPSPQVIEMMQRDRSEGLTLRAIADKLNGLGLRTPNGCQWYAGTVRKAMQSLTA